MKINYNKLLWVAVGLSITNLSLFFWLDVIDDNYFYATIVVGIFVLITILSTWWMVYKKFKLIHAEEYLKTALYWMDKI